MFIWHGHRQASIFNMVYVSALLISLYTLFPQEKVDAGGAQQQEGGGGEALGVDDLLDRRRRGGSTPRTRRGERETAKVDAQRRQMGRGGKGGGQGEGGERACLP